VVVAKAGHVKFRTMCGTGGRISRDDSFGFGIHKVPVNLDMGAHHFGAKICKRARRNKIPQLAAVCLHGKFATTGVKLKSESAEAPCQSFEELALVPRPICQNPPAALLSGFALLPAEPDASD